MQLIIIAAVVGALIALAVGGFARRIGWSLGLLDFPDDQGGRKRHDQVTPLVGGIAVVLATLAAIALCLWLGQVRSPVDTHLRWLGGGMLAMALVGLTDDRMGLGATPRLLGAVGTLAVISFAAPDFSLQFLRFTGEPGMHLLGWFGGVLTLLCLVGLLNAVNMADGKNGLVIGLSLSWTLLLAPAAPDHVLPVMAGLAAALAVLFFFNMANRLFLGDCGSYALSALIGLLSIYIYNLGFDVLRADRVALIFAVPVFDTIRLLTVRSLRGQSPFAADRDHLHHHLHYRFGWPVGLWIYLAMVLVPNLAAIAMPPATPALLFASLLLYALVISVTGRPSAADRHPRDFRAGPRPL